MFTRFLIAAEVVLEDMEDLISRDIEVPAVPTQIDTTRIAITKTDTEEDSPNVKSAVRITPLTIIVKRTMNTVVHVARKDTSRTLVYVATTDPPTPDEIVHTQTTVTIANTDHEESPARTILALARTTFEGADDVTMYISLKTMTLMTIIMTITMMKMIQ